MPLSKGMTNDKPPRTENAVYESHITTNAVTVLVLNPPASKTDTQTTEVQVTRTRVASAPVTATMRRMPFAIASSVTITTEPISLLRFRCLQKKLLQLLTKLL